MDSSRYINDHDDIIRLEKAKAISSFNRMRKITTLFRFVELFVFLFILSRFAPQLSFSFSYTLSVEQFKDIVSTLMSSRFVFILGNLIVVALFLISRSFSGEKEKKGSGNFYEEYVEKCRNDQILRAKEEERALKGLTRVEMRRSYSGNMEKPHERRHELRRSKTELSRKNTKVEDEMSGEEFRQTVEAFIARQQRILREEELLNKADSLPHFRSLPCTTTTSIKRGKF